MTREEAIKELQESHDMMRNYDVDESESRLMTALNMAIQALEQQKVKEIQGIMEGGWTVTFEVPEKEPCDDAISREAYQQGYDDARKETAELDSAYMKGFEDGKNSR